MRYILSYFLLIFLSCGTNDDSKDPVPVDSTNILQDDDSSDSQNVRLTEPFKTRSVKNFSNVIGWPGGKKPVAPPGFSVRKFADGLKNPRWIYIAPNGDILVAEANVELKGVKKVEAIASGKAKSQQIDESANRITLFRDTNSDGEADLRSIFLENLNQPLGMLIMKGSFYVANTDGLWIYPYKDGQVTLTAAGRKLLELPAGGYNNHWTRNIIANDDDSRIYIAVGSGSNVGENGMENEIRRANILEVNPDGSGERVYASGLRNPVGMDWAPGTKTLFTVVNERDEMGDDLVPDYLTGVRDGAFYGWPYAYFGPNEDPRRKGENPELVKKTIVPDLSLGAHTASLGLAFYDHKRFPSRYHGGAFIGQHGSWNHSRLVGYKVVFVPFSKGKPAGAPEDFLTGFISDSSTNEVFGRPAGVAILPDGNLLVADDVSNTIWRITAD